VNSLENFWMFGPYSLIFHALVIAFYLNPSASNGSFAYGISIWSFILFYRTWI